MASYIQRRGVSEEDEEIWDNQVTRFSAKFCEMMHPHLRDADIYDVGLV
jgi:hypothetical protein